MDELDPACIKLTWIPTLFLGCITTWLAGSKVHSFQGFGFEMSEILVQSPYGQYKMCTDRTGQNE